MRIMLDTNVLVSALLFPTDKMNQLFEIIISRHTMVLSDYIVDELIEVVHRKFPNKMDAISRMLKIWNYELICTPQIYYKVEDIIIRDYKDYPILFVGLSGQIDILVTGDKDFHNLEIKQFEILTPSGFLEKYGTE